MRRTVTWFRLWASVSLGALALAAQPSWPKGGPSFPEGDTEGLVMSPNPRIRYAWKRRVFFRKGAAQVHALRGSVPPSAAEFAAVTRTMDAISALLQATPEGSRGEGFWVNESRHIYPQPPYEIPAKAPPASWPLRFSVGFFPFYHEDILEAAGKWRLSVAGETESAYFEMNFLPGRLRQDLIASEDLGRDLAPVEFYPRPKETARVAGWPVYDGQELVMARAGRDPWAPAPIGRVLRAAMPKFEEDRASAERRLEGYRKALAEASDPERERREWERFEKENGPLRTSRPGNYELRKRNLENYLKLTREQAAAAADPKRDAKGAWYLNPLDAAAEAKRRMEALTPAEAAQPACYLPAEGQDKEGRYQMRGRILAAAGAPPGCLPLVMNNPDYFDRKLGRAAVQILVLRDFGRCAQVVEGRIVWPGWNAVYRPGGPPPHGCYRQALMWKDLDWAKLAALMAP
jgi:hypothetical protein